jgi:hypothetical protein
MYGLPPHGFFAGAIQHGIDITGTNMNSIDTWHLLVVTYDGSISTPQQRIKAYVDGQLQNLSFGFNHQPASTIGSQAIDTYLGARQESLPTFLVGFFNGKIDEVGIWNRALTASEIQQYYNSSAPQTQTYTWNTGATSNAISVTPTTTTKYYLTVNNGTSSCIDSVTIVVDTIKAPSLPDNLNACGDSVLLNPASNGKYLWNTGDTTASIYAKATGTYKVSITNGVCTATDSVYVSLVKAKITASKTRICKGETIILQADTTVSSLLACAKTDLPSNLQTGLVAYYPFCGNANDASGNGNHGTVNGATLTIDRFGRVNSAYRFNGTSDFISVADANTLDFTNNFSISIWMQIPEYANGNERVAIGKQRSIDGTGYQITAASAYNSSKYVAAINNNGQAVVIGNAPNDYLTLNKWSQIVVTYGAGILSIYKDGVLTGSLPSTISLSNSSLPLYIGKEFNTSRYFKGFLDDIALYNRALSASDVQQLYSISAPPPIQTYLFQLLQPPPQLIHSP